MQHGRQLIVLLLLTVSTSVGVNASPDEHKHVCARLISMPKYSPLALRAMIQGTVEAEVTIKSDGSVKGVKALSGHRMLQDQTIKEIEQWRFTCGHDQCKGNETARVVFEYKIDGEPLYLGCPQVSLTQGQDRIHVLLVSHPGEPMY